MTFIHKTCNLQFKQTRWNGYTAPASSRFIFSHDVSNSNMNCMNDFIETVKTNNPQLVVISGLKLCFFVNVYNVKFVNYFK